MKRPSLLVMVCLTVALFCLAYPIYVIRPFRAQGPRELALALEIMQWRFPISLACALLAIALTALSRRRIFLSVLTVLTIACAALTRINIYEKMFHPLGPPQFLPLSEVKLANDEKVVAVTLNTTARAYPVRAISYHHTVNDTLANVPIVATY